MLRLILVVLVITSSLGRIAIADNWPDFRGPTMQGVALGDAPVEWSEDSAEIEWKAPIPGEGWSSPVVWGQQIWVTTAIVERASVEQLKSRSDETGFTKNNQLANSLKLLAIAIDRESGSLIHEIELFAPEEIDPIHSLNSYASPSPVIDDNRVYSWFGTYGVAAVDTDSGDVLWRRQFPLEHYVGPGSSPLLVGDVLVLTCDGADVQFMIGLDAATGDTLWKTERPKLRTDEPDFRKSFCTPILLNVEGKQQVVAPGAQWIAGYDPHTGDELWRFDHGGGFSLVSRPVAYKDILCFATGFGGVGTVAIRLGGGGDLPESDLVWRQLRQAPNQPSPVMLNDKLYTISDGGIALCLDPQSGDVRWQKRMAGDYSASILAAGGRLYYFNRDGLTTVVQDVDEPEVIAKNQLEGDIMATPAVVEGDMIIRTKTALYRISTID